MNSGPQSSIHLLTGKTPFTKIECHRPNIKKVAKEYTKGTKSYSSHTNEYLKKGGSLPSVLPPSNTDPANVMAVMQQSSNCGKDSRCKSKTPSNDKKIHVQKIRDSSIQHTTPLDACGLERKMEILSSKLSKVQDIILSHMTDVVNINKQGSDKNEKFSAKDYTLIILEMNGHVPSYPYDPFEFSETKTSESAEIKIPSVKNEMKLRMSRNCDNSESLKALQDGSSLSNRVKQKDNSGRKNFHKL